MTIVIISGLALLLFAIHVYATADGKAHAVERELAQREDSVAAWRALYPTRMESIERSLRVFCESFGIAERLWPKFAPEDPRQHHLRQILQQQVPSGFLGAHALSR